MSNLARPTSRPSRPSPGTLGTPVDAPSGRPLLDVIRAARVGAAPLPGLTPATYARQHAAFEARSDQRALIGAHLASRLALRGEGPVSVLSVGCGDGSLDAPLAAGLADVRPERAVRYVGVDPYAASAGAFVAAMAGLDRPSLSAESHTATFAEAGIEETFDVVTFVHSMYYVADVVATILAAHALLRPGGELLVLSGPKGALNALTDVLAPPVQGHRQWLSTDVAAAFARSGLAVRKQTLEARIALDDADPDVLDFAVQARLGPDLRPAVRSYLAAVASPDATGRLRVPHPVDVYRVTRDG